METRNIYDYIERLSNLLRADSRSNVADYHLQPIHLEALHYLSNCNRYSDTPMGVTEYLRQTKGTVSQTLKLLEKKGLLTKHRDSNDKRITHLKVSKLGKEILERSVPSQLFQHACQQLPQNSQTQITAALKELLTALQRANGARPFGVCHSCRYHQVGEKNSFFCGLIGEPLSKHDVQLICREYESAS